MDTQLENRLAGIEARMANTSCTLGALQRVVSDIVGKQDPPFALQMRVALAEIRGEMFITLNEFNPTAAAIFLEGNASDD